MLTAFAWVIPPLILVIGWITWTRLPPGATETDDLVERAFATTLCGVFLAGLLGLLLAELGLLRREVFATAFAGVGLVLWRTVPRRAPTGCVSTRRDLAAASLIAVLAAATVAPASEDLLGGRDPGVYANTGSWLAREVRLDPRRGARGDSNGTPTALLRANDRRPQVFLLGFFVVGDGASGEITPQFLHLLPGVPRHRALAWWGRRRLPGPAVLVSSHTCRVHLCAPHAEPWRGNRSCRLALDQPGPSLVYPQSVHRRPDPAGGVRLALVHDARLRYRWPAFGGFWAALRLERASCCVSTRCCSSLRWCLHSSFFRPHRRSGGSRARSSRSRYSWRSGGLRTAGCFRSRTVRDLRAMLTALWVLTAVVLALCVPALRAPGGVASMMERMYHNGWRVWGWGIGGAVRRQPAWSPASGSDPRAGHGAVYRARGQARSESFDDETFIPESSGTVRAGMMRLLIVLSRYEAFWSATPMDLDAVSLLLALVLVPLFLETDDFRGSPLGDATVSPCSHSRHLHRNRGSGRCAVVDWWPHAIRVACGRGGRAPHRGVARESE